MIYDICTYVCDIDLVESISVHTVHMQRSKSIGFLHEIYKDEKLPTSH